MESSDLGELTAVPLARDAEIDRKHEIEGLYHFDPSSDNELFKLRASAIRLGEVLGIAAGAAEQSVDARWVIGDTASEKLGNEVPGHLVGNGATFESAEHVGIVKLEGLAGPVASSWKTRAKTNGWTRSEPELVEIQGWPKPIEMVVEIGEFFDR